jgi:hypothetical protein
VAPGALDRPELVEVRVAVALAAVTLDLLIVVFHGMARAALDVQVRA